jgi:hypothetical protein
VYCPHTLRRQTTNNDAMHSQNKIYSKGCVFSFLLDQDVNGRFSYQSFVHGVGLDTKHRCWHGKALLVYSGYEFVSPVLGPNDGGVIHYGCRISNVSFFERVWHWI